jgi:peroxiredoxin
MFLNQSLLPVGHPAPAFRLLDHRGFSVGPEDFSTRKGLVLVFFASNWLKEDLRMLQRYIDAHPRFEERDIQLLALSGINWETLHTLAQRLNPPFPLIFDPCCRYAKKYRTMLIPKFVTGRAVYALRPDCSVLFAGKGMVAPDEVLATFSS